MTSANSKWTVARVEELLAKATPGPWFWVKARTMQWLHNASGCFASISMPAFNHRGYHHRPTAEVDNELIAAAPEIIRYLLDSLTRARQEALQDAIAIAKGELIEFSGDSEDSFFNCATQDVIGALEAARDKEKG